MEKFDAKYWIKRFNLEPHPEGGFFRENLRSEIKHKPDDKMIGRNLYTSIYYLLENDDFSAFHRLDADEIWYYHYGTGKMEIFTIIDDELLKTDILGVGEGAQPFILIPQGHWFAVKPKKNDTYALVSCLVAPGFEFESFEMAEKHELISAYPKHKEIIDRLTR